MEIEFQPGFGWVGHRYEFFAPVLVFRESGPITLVPSMSGWLSFLQPRFWGKVGRAVLGEVNYVPPAWPGKIFDNMRRRPGAWAAVMVTAGVGWGVGIKSYEWWQAHKPRPRVIVEVRQVGSRVVAPGVTQVIGGTPVPQNAAIAFDSGVAKLDWVTKKESPGVTLSPARPGRWLWVSDSRLEFRPTTDWPAGTEFTVALDASLLPPDIKLKDTSWKFTTPAVKGTWSNVEFYTNPQDPEVHQITAELNFTHPVKAADVEKHIELKVIGGSPLFNWGGQAPAALFTVEEGKDQRQFFVRSSRIVIPEKQDFVRLTLSPGVPGQTGGKPSPEEASDRVRVPDVFSGFEIAKLSTEMIRTSEGTPQQFVFVDTKGYVKPDEIAKHVEAWLLPKDRPAEEHISFEKDYQWSGPLEVTPKVFALSKPVKLTPVETEKDDEAAPMSTRHGFRFMVENPGYLFLRVREGVNAVGGFRLGTAARDIAAVPEFPKEVEIQGKGAVLALNGERKISIQSRGAKHLRVTLARVPAGQVNHLVAFSEGNFASPNFYQNLTEDNLARFHREILQVPWKNDYEAAYTVFDFAEALKSVDSSDPDASRGLFFLTVEAVKPADPEDNDKGEAYGDPLMAKWVSAAGQQNERRRRYRDEDDEPGPGSAKRFVLVSDLGLLVKRSTDGSRDLFVQSIGKSEPLAGVTLTTLATNGQILTQAVSDADGHVHFSGDIEKLQHEKKPVAFTARLGNDLAFIPFHRPDRLLDFSRFDVGGLQSTEQERLDAFLFTERGVYRPGDAIHLVGMVKQLDWTGKVEGLPVEMVLTDAKQQVAKKQRFSLPADGCVEWNFATVENDPTGQYDVEMYLMQDEIRLQRLGRTAFRVEDFQPDRMKVSAIFNTAPGLAWVQPRDVKAIVKVETLFGQAAAERNVQAKMYLNPADFSFAEFPDFVFHDRGPLDFKGVKDLEDSEAGKKVDLGEKPSGNDGTAAFDLGLERFDGGSFQLNLNVEAFEAGGGRSVQAGRSLMVSPMPYVIGYHTDTPLDYIGKDVKAGLKLICLGPDLKPRAAPELNARIVLVHYVSVLTKKENGNYFYVSTRREKTVSEAKFAVPETGAAFALPTRDAGEFRLELRDNEGAVVCSTPFTIVGKGGVERSLDREAELNLKLARGTYNTGDTLELNLVAPYTGGGLITIERENVLGWKWFKSTTPATVQQIPLPANLDGTGYVSVACVRGLDSPEVFISPLSYAVQPFTANPDKHRLAVQLDAPKKVRPGEVLKIGYSTARPGRVVVFAVDEGIHQITNYKLPKPLEHFNRKRALETETHQLLDLILPEFSQLTRKATGGDGEDALKVNLNPFKRRKDAPVVYWSGLIASGADRREVSYTVPDYFDGSLKIMAVALADDTVGAAETQCFSRGPMVITPTVPTFAAPGDEFTVSLTVANNLEGANAPGVVQVNATGSEQVEFVGPAGLDLNVAPGHEASTRFRVRAKDVLGGAEIVFNASAADEKVMRRATLSVRPASPYVTKVQSGYFRLPTQDVKMDRVVYPQFRKAEATVSILPLGLARGLEAYLRNYPHGCSEQVTSQAMSRLVLAGEADFGFDPAESARQLGHAFALLRTRQAGNGGFGYWAANVEPLVANDFISVYVSHFLTEASEAHQAVPEEMLNSAMERMRAIARAKIGGLAEADIQAHAIYLLTRNGQVTTKELLNLRDTLDKGWKDKWGGQLCAPYMAATYSLLKKHAEGGKLMITWWQSTDKTPRLERWYDWYYRDPTVNQAQGFALLCLHFPEQAKNFGYDELKMITEPIRANRFNTLSAAYSILALKAYSKLAEKADVKLSISALPVQGEPQLILPEGGGVRAASFAPGLSGLRFHLDKGKTDLGAFYQASETGFDRGVPAKELADGLEVSRALVDKDGKPVTKLKVGETATMILSIRNNSVEALSNIALLDLMPGGFELVAGGLKPGLAALPGADYVDVREDRNILYLRLNKAETRKFSYPVKPVSAGKFALPPVFAECMYDRAVHGRNGAGSVVVE